MKKTLVIDTSALLALFWQEPGWQEVSAALNDSSCLMSAVNMAEVATKAQENMNVDAAEIHALFAELPLEIVRYDNAQAVSTGLLRNTTRHLGLSLGDRACLALAMHHKATVLTADRPWLEIAAALDLDIHCIRPDTH